jgi:hypothetical protein
MPLAKKPDAYKNINSSSVIITKQILAGHPHARIEQTKQEQTKNDIQITSELLIPWVFIK